MGCAASLKRKASAPHDPARKSPAQTAPSPAASEDARLAPALQECSPELLKVVKELQLEACLPSLCSLGVRGLEDVAELLVSDLEEAGLSRVQVRQLQRAVQAPAAGSGEPSASSLGRGRGAAGAAARATAPATVAGAFAPARAPQTSPQGSRLGCLGPEANAGAGGFGELAGGGDGDAAAAPLEEPSLAGRAGESGQVAAKSLSWVEKSDRSQRLSGPLEPEALDLLSADSTPLDNPQAPAEPMPDGALARSRASLAQEKQRSLQRSAEVPEPPQEPEKTMRMAPCQDGRLGGLPGSEVRLPTLKDRPPPMPPPARASGSAAAGAPAAADAAGTFEFDVTLLPTLPADQATLLPTEQASAPAPGGEQPEEEQTILRSPVVNRSAFYDGSPESIGVEPAPEEEPASRTPGRRAACEAPEEGPARVMAAGLRGRDGVVAGRARPSKPDDWHSVMLRQQPDQAQAQDGSVSDKMPEALKRRLEKRADQRSQSRNSRAPQSSPPYQQQIAPPPRSPPPGQAARAGSLPARNTSADMVVVGSRTPSRPRKGGERSQSASSPAAEKGEKAERGGRQMFDKNALRKIHRELFIGGIRRYRQQALEIEPEGSAPGPDLASCTLRPAPDAVRVFVRKRPLFEHEENDRGEYDVATVVPGRPLPTQLILHSCLFQADLKTPYVSHLHFEYDHVFREGAQDHEVYRVAASELVRHAREGSAGTMFMFGQTGSGKTHTMTAIEGMAAHDLFEGAAGGEPWLSLQFIELCGNHCFDLLVAGNKDKRPELKLREHGDGSYAAEGAVQLQPKGPQELCAALRAAHARRATSATDANATSSRSHAVCTLRLLRSGGRLTLADCAGTERRKDSMFHSKERQQEGAEINASLHALKECVRYASTRQRVPPHVFRASALTKLLSGAFAHGDGSQLAVICTVSPCAMDTEHTLATLRTGMTLGGRGAEREEKEVLTASEQQPREAHPKQWTPEQVGAWLARAGGGKFADVRGSLPSNFTGQMLVRLTEGRCVQLCGDDGRRGRLLFDLLHQEIRRAELSRRPPQASP